MQTFAIEPLVGVGPVRIGMTREQVRHALRSAGATDQRARGPNTDTFFGAAFQVMFGKVWLNGPSPLEVPALWKPLRGAPS